MGAHDQESRQSSRTGKYTPGREGPSGETERTSPAGNSNERGVVPPEGDARRGTDRNDRQEVEQERDDQASDQAAEVSEGTGRDWSSPPRASRDRAGTRSTNEDAANPNRDMDKAREGPSTSTAPNSDASASGQARGDAVE